MFRSTNHFPSKFSGFLYNSYQNKYESVFFFLYAIDSIVNISQAFDMYNLQLTGLA